MKMLFMSLRHLQVGVLPVSIFFDTHYNVVVIAVGLFRHKLDVFWQGGYTLIIMKIKKGLRNISVWGFCLF